MADETTIYEVGSIKITNLRAVFNTKTYSVSNITAVEMGKQEASIGFPILLSIGGGLLLVLFLVSLLGSMGNNYNAASNTDANWSFLAFGVLLLVPGVLMFRSAKPSYSLKISAASGEIEAYTSDSREEIEKIVQAMNDAIIKKG